MDFLGMGPVEILVVVAVALIVVGPRKLPQLGRQVGRAIYQFRKATQELSEEFSREFMDVNQTVQDTKAGFTAEIKPLSDLQNSISQGIRSLAAVEAPAVVPPPPPATTPAPEAAANIVNITETEGYRTRRSLAAQNPFERPVPVQAIPDPEPEQAPVPEHWALQNVPDSDADIAASFGDESGALPQGDPHAAPPVRADVADGESPPVRRAQG